jgi:tetratricopeptide (TPR) repeat protein
VAGELDEAERLLRRARDGFHLLGVDVDTGLAAALLGRVCVLRDRLDEALELTVESEKLTGDDLRAGIAWRSVRAEALARRGKHERALALAHEAVALAAPTDALLGHADALLSLSAVLEATGATDASHDAARAAMALYADKGATALVTDRDLPAPAAPGVAGAVPDSAVPENAAIRFCRRWVPVVLASDWATLRSMFSDRIVGLDHRPIVGGEPMIGPEAVLAANRGVVEVGVTALELTPLAVGGDRCVLLQAEYLGGLGGLAVLQLIAVDGEERMLRSEVFDLDQADAALARLAELAELGP